MVYRRESGLDIRTWGEQIYHTLGFNAARRNAYFRATFGEAFPVETFNEMTREIFYQLKEKEGVPKKQGVDEILSYAKGREYLLAVATSSRGPVFHGAFERSKDLAVL